MPTSLASSRFTLEPLRESIEAEESPLLSRLVSWVNSVSVFRYEEAHDPRDLSGDQDHRTALSWLIAMGEHFVLEIETNPDADLSAVNLSLAAIRSEIQALRDDFRITHEPMMPEKEADEILLKIFHGDAAAA